MSEKCELKGRPCHGIVKTVRGKETTWELIERFSAKGNANSWIVASVLPARDAFRDSPREVAETYSEICGGHSCARCTDLIEGVVVTLGLNPPKSKE